jgi:SAM-dependent methyltransferase
VILREQRHLPDRDDAWAAQGRGLAVSLDRPLNPAPGLIQNGPMEREDHWERVYGAKEPDAVSWYRPHLERSLALIEGAGLDRSDPIIDVGGGAATLVDDLLARGYGKVAVLDISSEAITRAKARLGAKADQVTWIVGDITRAALPERGFAFWHDRAVFHFLTAADDRQAYVTAVRRSLRVDGHIVVATFGPHGPERCSGLEVARYDSEALHGQFGGSFRKVGSSTEQHTTPWGTEQEFVYCYCRLEP